VRCRFSCEAHCLPHSSSRCQYQLSAVSQHAAVAGHACPWRRKADDSLLILRHIIDAAKQFVDSGCRRHLDCYRIPVDLQRPAGCQRHFSDSQPHFLFTAGDQKKRTEYRVVISVLSNPRLPRTVTQHDHAIICRFSATWNVYIIKISRQPPITRYFSRVKISENAGSERIKQLLVYSSRSIQNLAAVLDRLMYQYGDLMSSNPRKSWLHNHSDLQTPVLIAYVD
jgi:hypothetical protein